MYIIEGGKVFQISEKEVFASYNGVKNAKIRRKANKDVQEVANMVLPNCINQAEFNIRMRIGCSTGKALDSRIIVTQAVWSDVKEGLTEETLNERYYRKDILPEDLGKYVHQEPGGAFDLDKKCDVHCTDCVKNGEVFLRRINAFKEGVMIKMEEPQLSKLMNSIMRDWSEGDDESSVLFVNGDGEYEKVVLFDETEKDKNRALLLHLLEVDELPQA